MLYQTENPHGGDLYSRPVELDFSANINPLGTPDSVKRAIAAAAESVSHYPDPYCRALVAALADYEGQSADHILCGNGAADLIFSYCAAIKPRRAVVLAPTFAEYEAALATVHCEVLHHPLQAENDFAPTESILATITKTAPDLVMLCNPNNPTGRTFPPALLEQVLALCASQGTRLFIDECFLDLTDRGEVLSLKPFLSRNPNLFLLKAFTKSYGMAGVRLGYALCADAALLTAMGRATQSWNVSLLAQQAGLAALKERGFLAQANAIIRTQRAALTQGLQTLGLKTIPSQTNYILFHSAQELKNPLLARGILIRSCANYPGLGEGWYRIAVKLPQENARLLTALKEVFHG